MRVAAFTKYGSLAASTRQRFLQYAPYLAAEGIELLHHPLLPNAYVQSLSTGTRFPRRKIAASYVARAIQLIRSSADVLWVYAELFPFLPGFFERLAISSRKPLVYDFDDAFFHPHENQPRGRIKRLLTDKLEPLMRNAAVCCCGNAYLRDYAARFCRRSIILPTVVDTEVYVPLRRRDGGEVPVVGWIGSPTTWENVQPLLPLLSELCAQSRIRFRAIGAGRTAQRDQFPGLELVEWSQTSEVAELQKMDVGIMPLLDLPFQRGKSGYKLIQYMACGLPVVASPTGVNSEIVSDGVNGLLAASTDQWKQALEILIRNPELREKMGNIGRLRTVADYSLQTQAPRLAAIFDELGQ